MKLLHASGMHGIIIHLEFICDSFKVKVYMGTPQCYFCHFFKEEKFHLFLFAPLGDSLFQTEIYFFRKNLFLEEQILFC